MKRKPRWTLEMLTASLAVLCGLLLLVLLVQRPTAWLLLAVLVVLWGIGATLFQTQPDDPAHPDGGLIRAHRKAVQRLRRQKTNET